jgi:hypothetical protein
MCLPRKEHGKSKPLGHFGSLLQKQRAYDDGPVMSFTTIAFLFHLMRDALNGKLRQFHRG